MLAPWSNACGFASVREMRGHGIGAEFGAETGQRVAEALFGLAHHRSADQQALGVDARLAYDCRSVTWRGLQHAVVEGGPFGIAECVAGLDRQQIVRVVADRGEVAEGVPKAPLEEVPARKGQFLGRRVAVGRRQQAPPGRHPPAGIVLTRR